MESFTHSKRSVLSAVCLAIVALVGCSSSSEGSPVDSDSTTATAATAPSEPAVTTAPAESVTTTPAEPDPPVTSISRWPAEVPIPSDPVFAADAVRLSEFCLAVCIVDDETGALQQLLEASDDADLADAFASVAPLDTTALREMCTTFWTASEAERLQMAADSGADTDSAVNAYLAVRRFTCDS